MLIDLNRYQGDGYVSLKDVAQRENISKKYLEQIVPVLNRSGILCANRGYQGGCFKSNGGEFSLCCLSGRTCHALRAKRVLSNFTSLEKV